MQLAERYRPRDLDHVVGQPKAVAKVRQLGARGYGGRSYLISGPSGTGKTTLARIIAASVASPLAIEEVNAADCTVADIRGMESEWQTTALAPAGSPNGRAYIFNEVHLMRGTIVSRFLTTLEAIPAHVAVLFTTTTNGLKGMFDCDESDVMPFASRCARIATTMQGFQEPIAAYVRECAIKEGLDGAPLAKYVTASRERYGNGRALFHAVECGEIGGQ